MKKLLPVLAWSAGAVGITLMLLGIITVFAGGIMLHHRWWNFFYPGVGFVVVGIFLFVGVMAGKES